MKSIAIERLEAEDIGKQVEKIIKGLGYPEPPLRLEEVREILSLNRQFYSSSDTGAVREFVSRLKVAGKQIIWRPTLLWDAIKKADLSALYLLDQKRILIDESKPKLKHRWNEAHEIINSVIPWHNEMNMGDTDLTLKPTCHAIVEAEANFGAGQLLFLHGRFAIDARDCDCSVEAIKGLSKRYGNTITSTLWRFVEQVYPDKAIVGIISQHPNHTTPDFDPSRPCRHCIQSPKF